MPKNRPSPTGERAELGYTLIELLVVLTIMGLLLAAAPAIINAARPGIEAKTAVHALANDLRTARAAAVANNVETWVVVDAPAHAYAMEPGGGTHRLPANLSLELRGPGGDEAVNRIELRFYPDGSSTGGSIRIASGGRQHWIVDHWLTGQITIDE
jgi:general secretion pathway protein H